MEIPCQVSRNTLTWMNSKREIKLLRLLNIGLKNLNRTTLFFSLESHVFITANKNYQQAVECFRYGLYEAAMVMARATIDAALYASKYHVIDKIEGYDKGMGGNISGHYTSKGLRKEGSWAELKKEAEVLTVNVNMLKEAKEIRDSYSNFSVHNAARQMEETMAYAKLDEKHRETAAKPKWQISQAMAEGQ